MWLVVLGLGLPAAFRNPVAAGLVMQWALGQASWLATGDSLPIGLYLATDIAVLAIFALKPLRTLGDWMVATIFPTMWIMYLAPATDYDRWWILWFMVLLQFMSAAVGALEEYKLARTRSVSFGLKPPRWFRAGGWILEKL